MAAFSTNKVSDVLTHVGIIIASFIIIFLLFFFIYLPWRTNHGESITVPQLKGLTMNEVEDLLDEKNLKYAVSDCTFVVNVTPLTVFSQYPKPNATIKEGRKIYLTIVSDKAPMVTLPDVLNRSFESGKNQVASVGFIVDKPEYVPALEENTILRIKVNGSEVTPGNKLPKGSRVTLVIGDGYGNQSVDVPNFVGMPFEEVEVSIAGSGLNIGNIVYENDPVAPANTVLKQRPQPGNKLRMGDVVDIWVAGYASNQEDN
ncbi:MAG: beta-lactam-binding protein with PASTA domain [Spirosomataceae bacterium]|jgi:beta-lactam-binding protein with PASTA domain